MIKLPEKNFLPNEQSTLDFARKIAETISPPAIVYLKGHLGAGKTTFVRGFLRALGYQGPVRSPSYTLIENYSLPALSVVHVDFYRLTDPESVEFLALRDELNPSTIVFIEWPERGEGHLPPPNLILEFQLYEEGRLVTALSC